MEKQTEQLRKVLHDYAVPDPKIVSKLPKGGTTLDFVGHADITRILIEIDPEWQIEPAMVDMNGLPAVVVTGNMVSTLSTANDLLIDTDVTTNTGIVAYNLIGHAEAINMEFEDPIDEEDARDALRGKPGVTVIDHRLD